MTKSEARNEADSPKFGRLLLVLLGVVVFILLLTWLTANYYQV